MPESLSWRVRVGEGNSARLSVVALSAIAAGMLGVLLLHKAIFFLIGFVVIAGSTTEVWLGVRYRLDETGASARIGPSVTAIAWVDVKRLIVNDVGVTLSPLATDSRLSAFRGVFLRAGSMGNDQLLDEIKRFGGDNVRRLV